MNVEADALDGLDPDDPRPTSHTEPLDKIRAGRLTPDGTATLFKVYILDESEAFFDFYPVVRHTVTIDDVLGGGVPLFHFAAGDGDDDMPGPYVQQARAWFDSVWNTIAREQDA